MDTSEAAPRAVIEVDARALATAPVDILAGLVVFLVFLLAGVLVVLTGTGFVSGFLALVIWLVQQPAGLIALVVPILLFGGYGVWLGSFYGSVVALEALGIRVNGAGIYGCFVLAPVLAPTVGAIAGLRSLGRSAGARPFLAVVGAAIIVAVAAALGGAL